MDKFKNNIVNIYGVKGAKFVQDLDLICHEVKTENDIDNLEPVGEWTYHAIYKCVFNGKDAIVKLGIDYNELLGEINYLENFSDGIGPIIYKSNQKPAYYIMEYIYGEDLSCLDSENEKCEIFVNILNNLRSADTKEFKTFIEYQTDLKYKSKYISKDKIDKSLAIINKYYDSSNLFLLHGDLHHYNIINKRFIDPKGIIGNKIFELGPFLRNELDNIEHLSEKAKILASLTEFDESEIMEIAFLDFILSTIWFEMDNMDVPKTHLEMIHKIWNLL